MAKFTNTAPGARGVTLKDGNTFLVEAGATFERTKAEIAEMHPDIVEGDGTARHATKGSHNDGDIVSLTAKVAELEKQVADSAKVAAELAVANAKVAELEKQVDELTKLKK